MSEKVDSQTQNCSQFSLLSLPFIFKNALRAFIVAASDGNSPNSSTSPNLAQLAQFGSEFLNEQTAPHTQPGQHEHHNSDSMIWEDIGRAITKIEGQEGPDVLMTQTSFTSSNASGGGSVLILDTSNHVVMSGSELQPDTFQMTPTTSNAHHQHNYSQQ